MEVAIEALVQPGRIADTICDPLCAPCALLGLLSFGCQSITCPKHLQLLLAALPGQLCPCVGCTMNPKVGWVSPAV